MIWVLPLLIFLSCQKHSDWQKETISEKKSRVTRILHKAQDPLYGIDVEILEDEGKFCTYLQVHSEVLTPSANDPTKTEGILITPHGELTFLATLHKGGQRALLDAETQKELLQALEEGIPITISLSDYREILQSSHFQRKAPSVLKKIQLY